MTLQRKCSKISRLRRLTRGNTRDDEMDNDSGLGMVVYRSGIQRGDSMTQAREIGYRTYSKLQFMADWTEFGGSIIVTISVTDCTPVRLLHML